MTIEYIKLEPSEQFYGKKHLLYSEMETLTVLKRYQKYKNLRKVELALKTMLKRSVMELQEEMKILDNALPRIKIERTEEDKMKMIAKATKRSDLEAQISEIKNQIARLQG